MTQPWDIPPTPRFGDTSADLIYGAAGAALCAWEEIEVRLSWLYGVLTDRAPLSHTILQEYGKDLNFKDRLANLERVANAYFTRKPDQALEGDLESLLSEARNFSLRRNEIAHGVVRAKGRTDYFLYPPSYANRRWRAEHAPTFTYTSAHINNFSRHFLNLLYRLDDMYKLLRRRLRP